MTEAAQGFAVGVVVASVIWALVAVRLLDRAADEIEALERAWRDAVGAAARVELAEELDGFDEWEHWGEYPPIPPHGGVG